MSEVNNEGDDRATGDSKEQQEAEIFLVNQLSQQLGVELKKKRIDLPKGGWLEIDGYSNQPLVLCEAWAHQGKPKSAQKAKVTTDAFKLLLAERVMSKIGRKFLVFADKSAAGHFIGKSWMSKGIEAAGIEVVIFDLPDSMRLAVQSAQRRQCR